MYKAVVTGAAGLVGQNLIPMLTKEFEEVVCIDKHEENLELLKNLNPNITAVQADCSEDGEWQKHIAGADVLITMAAQISARDSELFYKNSFLATKNAVGTAKKYNVPHIIHISSSVVISKADDDYTKTKRMAEEHVVKSGMPYTILRPSLIYGPFDNKHLGYLSRFLEKSPLFPVPGDGKIIRQPIYVLDVAKVIASAARRGPKDKIYNLIGNEKIFYADLIKTIAKIKNIRRLIVPLPISLFAFLMNAHAKITGNPPFTEDQLKALVAGDVFQPDSWPEIFGVPYTPFETAWREMLTLPQNKYVLKK
ncbi:MAG: NAD-dependent epimerase/dehydratase family protein [DPANN group archaeon]|nr:NAD-dependent epimerase/dehydratase family protein [DPANN group archaeon]